jgi:hypothetical protein
MRKTTDPRRPGWGRAPGGEIPREDFSARVRAELRRRPARAIGFAAGVSAEVIRRIAAGERVMRASLAAVRASLAGEGSP